LQGSNLGVARIGILALINACYNFQVEC
jgi:hypothetical protein